MKSAYIHIPFCKQKCLYCDFNSFANYEKWIDEYMKALKKEILKYDIKELYTTYIGGGTPSFIPEKDIEDVLQVLPRSEEITIEMNPGTITFDKLMTYKTAGVNRVSIGLQTTDDNILKQIGRIHTLEDFDESYKLVRQAGFQNVNVDLMFGLPNQSLQIFKDSLEYVISLKPEHISSYSLILHDYVFENLPSDEEERAMYHYMIKRLKEAGYIHYEISNFAKPGFESKHNVMYWEQKEYYGFGAGASSFIDNKRYTNVSNIQEYIAKINDNKEVRVLEEVLNDKTKLNEYMILKLRMLNGINIKEANEKFKINILDEFKESLNKLTEEGLLEITDSIVLTEKGLDFANIVWEEFV